MKYFIISEKSSGDLKGILFHDYSRSYYSAHTDSDVLQTAIDAVVKKVSLRLIKSSEKILKVSSLNFDNPFWSQRLVEGIVGNSCHWYLSESGSLPGITHIDDFIREKMN